MKQVMCKICFSVRDSSWRRMVKDCWSQPRAENHRTRGRLGVRGLIVKRFEAQIVLSSTR